MNDESIVKVPAVAPEQELVTSSILLFIGVILPGCTVVVTMEFARLVCLSVGLTPLKQAMQIVGDFAVAVTVKV